MVRVTFSELRNNAKKYFDAVEQGESVEVYRHGKPVAIVSPITQHAMDSWRHANPVEIDGVSLSKAILADRRKSR